MRPSIRHHIFWRFFSASLLTIFALIILVELLTDDLENHMVALELESDQAHYGSLTGDVAQTWRTATTLAAFVPEHTAEPSKLPTVFQGLPVPFSGEIETPDEEYWIQVRRTPTGVLYTAKETSLFEQREEIFLFGIIGAGGILIIISLALTHLSTRRIVKPLTELTREISHVDPRLRAMRISESYHDQELYSIATTFNSYLDTMEEYMEREQMLIGMASHELRTPAAVASGALDILYERGTMTKEDRRTVGRIREAVDEMTDNISAILALARKQPASRQLGRLRLSHLIESVLQERLRTHPSDRTRLEIVSSEIDHELVSDSTLIKMLLRNLIQNALEHTQGKVTLQQSKQGLLISDEGSGLPQDVRLQIEERLAYPRGHANESGLGLFIVTHICERLGWSIEVIRQAGMEAGLQIHLPGAHSRLGQ